MSQYGELCLRDDFASNTPWPNKRHTQPKPFPVVKAMRVTGSLQGLLLSLSLHQTFRNESSEDISIESVFPLGLDAVLLGMDVTLGEKRMHAQVMPNPEAKERFDKAVDQGDTPVNLWVDELGHYHADLGNLRPGEEISIDLQLQQIQHYDKGRIRLRIPTAIGTPFLQGDGAASPQSHALVEQLGADSREQIFELALDLLGDAALGTVKSPSHKLLLNRFDEGKPNERLQVGFGRRAYLDQDFVLWVDLAANKALPKRKNRGYALIAPEGDDACVVVAAFDPSMPRPSSKAERPLALKILVDCSGSMDGISMDSAKAALLQILDRLQEDDRVSFARFGSDVEHDINGLMDRCRPAHLGHLRQAIVNTQADMGGTEMVKALLSCIHDVAQDNEGPVDLLLITDGAVDDTQTVVQAARDRGHRISVIGVGMGPGERVIQTLSTGTGGGAILAHPGDSFKEAVQRAFERLREPQAENLQLVWGDGLDSHLAWASPLPLGIFSGDTVLAMARFQMPLDAVKAKLQPTLRWTAEGKAHACEVALVEMGPEDTPRLVAAEEIKALQGGFTDPDVPSAESNESAIEALGLKYRLLTSATSMFLVHERAAEDKVRKEATVYQVAPMAMASFDLMCSTQSSGPGHWDDLLTIHSSSGPIDDEIPAQRAVSLDGLLELFYEELEHAACNWRTISAVSALTLEPSWESGLAHLEGLGLSRDFAMVLLLLWLLGQETHGGGDGTPPEAEQAAIWLQEVAIDLAPVLTRLAQATFDAAAWLAQSSGKGKKNGVMHCARP